MNLTGNDNQQSVNKPSMKEVDDLARELCDLFNNHKYFKWYCDKIWKLGLPRIYEIKGRVEGAKLSGRLFTQYINEEIKRSELQQKLKGLYGEENNKTNSQV
jgi:hypothetical protein